MTPPRHPFRVTLKSDEFWGYLRRKHLSHGDFAKQVCIAPGYLSQLISGQRSPSPRLTARFLEVLEVRFDDLFRIVRNAD